MQVCSPCSKPGIEGCRWAWPVCGLQITRPEFSTVAGAGAVLPNTPTPGLLLFTCTIWLFPGGMGGQRTFMDPPHVGQRSKHWDTAGVGGHHGPWSHHWEPSSIRAKRHNVQGPERVPGAQEEGKPRASHKPSQCRPALDNNRPNHHPP